MPHYKGTALVFVRQSIAGQGTEREQQFFATLTETEQYLYQTCLPSQWVPLAEAEKLLRKAADFLYAGDRLRYQRLGYERAREHLTGVYRILAKLSSPVGMIRQAPRVWSTYYDQGSARATVLPGEHEAIMVVENFPELPELFREITQGYISAALVICGAKKVELHRDDSNPTAWKWFGRWE